MNNQISAINIPGFINKRTTNIDVHWFNLNFKSGERQFREDYFAASLLFNRLSIIVSILFFTAFAFLDQLTLNEVKGQLFTIRFAIVCPMIVILFSLTFTRFYKDYWQLITSIGTFVAGASIVAMTITAPQLGSGYYYVGTILVLMYCYMLLKLRFVWAAVTGWAIVLSYIVSVCIFPNIDHHDCVTNVFFLLSANILGMLGAYSLEYLYRKDYFHRKLLRIAQENVIRANGILEYKVKEKTKALQEDIEVRKETEKKLIQAIEKAEESDYLKTSFLQNMSHEIRTPLNAICGFTGILTGSRLVEEERNKYISIIQKSSDQLLAIVSDVLTISSLETGQVKVYCESFNVSTVMHDLYVMFSSAAEVKGLQLKLLMPEATLTTLLFTDKTKFIQVISNLLTNAIKFTEQGSVTFGYEQVKHELVFFVEDTGLGIDEDMITKVFERFRQVDPSQQRIVGGNGLGLAISKGFVELLGGRIWVESEINQGSRFYFTFLKGDVN
ncbi:sensor histidine kinase [Labilibacter marinus]|uniref:sensor histidine kinase n=1 Tax=Labilibacter marinus TaxID=1477105 RepID=UPI00082DE361|nr:ATP-binding protein [Labilibacter marinus]